MSIPHLQYEKTWRSHADFPTYEGSEAQVRDDLQYHPDAVLDYLNNTLIPALEGAEGAAHLGDSHLGKVSLTLEDIYATLQLHREEMNRIAMGEAPEAIRAAVAEFTPDGWVESEEGYTLRILPDTHRRTSPQFGCRLLAQGAGGWESSVWYAISTSVGYDETTGDVVLTADAPYAGRAVFFGV